MAPLIVQLLAWTGFYVAGRFGGWQATATPVSALRFAMAVMFFFTAISHFVPATRAAFVRMVPARLPYPEFLVTITGALQFGGALGLLSPTWTRAAAVCLAALLVAMTPANVAAASANLEIAGRRVMRVPARLALQAFWILCLIVLAVFGCGESQRWIIPVWQPDHDH